MPLFSFKIIFRDYHIDKVRHEQLSVYFYVSVKYVQGGSTNVAQLWRLITLRVFIENTRIIYQIKDKYLVYAHAKYLKSLLNRQCASCILIDAP